MGLADTIASNAEIARRKALIEQLRTAYQRETLGGDGIPPTESQLRDPVGTTRHFPGPNAYPDPKRTAANNDYYTRLGLLNTQEDRVREARETFRSNYVAPQTPINPLSDIEARIAALANKPDTPGQWISPYSQDYLNQLGDRLSGAGAAAQQAFLDAKNEIANNYAGGTANRALTQDTLTNELQANGQNIGVDYLASMQGKQATNDRDYLTQMTDANRANDLSTNDKLGVVANQFGANLGMQAREGLLTPKQWQEGQSGLSSGDRLMADFLMNKYNQELENQRMAAELAADQKSQSSMLSGFGDFAKTLTMGAGDEYKQNYPDVVQGLAGIADPRTMDEANRIWNITGDPAEAVKYLETQYKEDNPNLFTSINPPVWMPSAAPLGAVDSPAYRASQQQLANYQRALADYQENTQEQGVNQAMWQRLIDFFNQYNPNRTGVNTSKTVSNTTSEKYS